MKLTNRKAGIRRSWKQRVDSTGDLNKNYIKNTRHTVVFADISQFSLVESWRGSN